MKKRYSDAQIISFFREVEAGVSVRERMLIQTPPSAPVARTLAE